MKKPIFSKQNIIVFLVSLAFAYVMTNNTAHIADIVSVSMPIILIGLLLFIALFLIFLAGIAVMRPLIVNAAAGLSLVIFLGQSYCASGVSTTVNADQALKAFIFLGLSYVIYDFSLNVLKELSALSKIFKQVDGKWTWESVVMFSLLILFVILFIWILYTVISPIILGLCVYK